MRQGSLVNRPGSYVVTTCENLIKGRLLPLPHQKCIVNIYFVISSHSVVEVVELGGGQEGEVIATVLHCGVEDHKGKPHPHHNEVGPHDYWSEGDGYKVDQYKLHRMAVDRHYTSGSCPLMVDLVDVLVQQTMMKQPAESKKVPGDKFRPIYIPTNGLHALHLLAVIPHFDSCVINII